MLYYTEPHAGVGSYRIHWCFIGEIVRNASLGRPTFHVRDRDGKLSVVSLYLDDMKLYDPKHWKAGNTICVMYPFQHEFLDGSHGLRLEDGDHVMGTHLWIADYSVTVFVTNVH
jgi:hypothetical protein